MIFAMVVCDYRTIPSRRLRSYLIGLKRLNTVSTTWRINLRIHQATNDRKESSKDGRNKLKPAKLKTIAQIPSRPILNVSQWVYLIRWTVSWNPNYLRETRIVP
jgi:hypothetical protein